MPRDIPVGNGSLLVVFDADYTIRDLYYPRVGKENHALGNPAGSVCGHGKGIRGSMHGSGNSP